MAESKEDRARRIAEQRGQWINAIGVRARYHEGDYPSFGYERFMEWIEAKSYASLRSAYSRSVADLNRSRRLEHSCRRMTRD